MGEYVDMPSAMWTVISQVRLRENVLKEVQAYSSSRGEYEAEVAAPKRYLD